MKEEYVLELENIRKEYPGVVALKDVTLRLKKGEILGLGGMAGQGKIAVANGIMGLFKSKGDIKYKNEALVLNKPTYPLEKGIFFVSEDRKGVGLLLDESIENLETRTQIKKKTAEIVNLQATEKIANGKLFNEIFELTRYSNKDRESDKCYYDWLKALNLNDRTVLRYRNIAKVFEQVKNPKNKSFIGFLSWEDADFLYKNFKENIDVFGDKEFNSLMEMRAFIKNSRVKQIEEKPKKIFNIEKPDYDRIFVETEEAWNNLDEKTKDKINTYLSKIEELVKSKEIEEAEVVE